MRLKTLAAMAVFVWIPSAQATLVWFEASGITPATSVTAQGPGQALQLVCDVPAIPGVHCDWTVSVRASLGATLHSWDLDLRTAPINKLGISNLQIAPGNPFQDLAFPGTPGTGLSLLYNSGGLTFTAVPPQTLTLLTFNLRWSFPLGGANSSAAIFGGSSTAELFAWATNLGEYDVVQFGPNAAAPAFPGAIGPLPLITLLEIPEPASLTLLAMGAAMVLRRRSRPAR